MNPTESTPPTEGRTIASMGNEPLPSHLLNPSAHPSTARGWEQRSFGEKDALQALWEAVRMLGSRVEPDETAALMFAAGGPAAPAMDRHEWTEHMQRSIDAVMAGMRLTGERTLWLSSRVWAVLFTGESGRLAVRVESRMAQGPWLVGVWPAVVDRFTGGEELRVEWEGSLLRAAPWTEADLRDDPPSCRRR